MWSPNSQPGESEPAQHPHSINPLKHSFQHRERQYHATVRNEGSAVTQSKCESSLYNSLVWRPASYVTLRSLHFLIFKMGLIIERVLERIKRCNLCDAYGWHSFGKHLVSTYFVSDTVLGTGDTPVNKQIPAPRNVHSCGRSRQ